ncbi:MAG TPA: hypothetical protein VFM82_06580 [Flavobacteriaceae bacterium]|nr:hypothetical protein [Flavobacteriaceae bacterium]
MSYLKNSGVEYLDVRAEMTDHVASEIESKIEQGDQRGFYEIFKSYMLEHKSTLLKSLKKFRKQADKKMLGLLRKNAIHWKTIIAASFIFGLFFISKDFVFEYLSFFFFGFYAFLLAICFFPLLFLKKNKFSTLQRLVFWFGLVGYIFLIQMNANFVSNEITGTVFFAFLIWIFATVAKTVFNQTFYFKNKFL